MSPVAVNMPVTTSPKLMLDVSRRPSPWHEIAHNLSATAVPTNTTTLSKSPERERTPSPTPLSASQALREREALLPLTDSSVRRYHLVRPSPRPAPVPKLAAERDKEGHIEYKLKLIDPTPERFERLVTQMMWRLMQGHNEAIYEIGLADDGTVIGLTRTEMDESLRTLELMASEVGATVLVLREIVLAGPLRASPSRSMSSSNPSPGDRWMAYRPDLGHRKKGVGKGRRAKRRDVFFNSGKGESSIEKRVIFDHADMEGTDSDDSPSPRRQSSHTTDEDVERTDEDVPPFHLDLEDVAKPESPSPVRKRKWVRKIKSPPRVSDAELAERERKAEKKQIRQEMRREERRLDLLRGDGTSSLGVPTPTPSHAPIPQSSLRLATPASSPDESFLDDLSHLPLDSLSLSFADVRNVSSSPSSSTDTEVALGEEMICVEALVVRKVQHKWGDLGEWGFGGGEDACGCGGGEEEVVGRGGDEVEVEVEGDKEDSWGLGSEEEGAG